MMSQQVRTAYAAEPFQPFAVHLADGRQIVVHHREFMASAPNSRTAVVYQPDGSFNIVDLVLVTDLELKPPTPANGKRRRRPDRE